MEDNFEICSECRSEICSECESEICIESCSEYTEHMRDTKETKEIRKEIFKYLNWNPTSRLYIFNDSEDAPKKIFQYKEESDTGYFVIIFKYKDFYLYDADFFGCIDDECGCDIWYFINQNQNLNCEKCNKNLKTRIIKNYVYSAYWSIEIRKNLNDTKSWLNTMTDDNENISKALSALNL
jgi:hypothetical protein